MENNVISNGDWYTPQACGNTWYILIVEFS